MRLNPLRAIGFALLFGVALLLGIGSGPAATKSTVAAQALTDATPPVIQ